MAYLLRRVEDMTLADKWRAKVRAETAPIEARVNARLEEVANKLPEKIDKEISKYYPGRDKYIAYHVGELNNCDVRSLAGYRRILEICRDANMKIEISDNISHTRFFIGIRMNEPFEQSPDKDILGDLPKPAAPADQVRADMYAAAALLLTLKTIRACETKQVSQLPQPGR
jgi:hypothetical protein